MIRGALISVFLLVGSLSATSVRPMSVERLTEAAQVVVRAQAMESWSEWNADRTLIHTYTRFRVLRTLKGDAGAAVVVKQMGGRAEGYTQRVSGVRGWRAGEETVLFLRPSFSADVSRATQTPVYAVAGLMQGDFRVQRDSSGEATASNAVSGVEAVERASGQVTPFRGTRMTLKQLEARVEEAAGR